MKIRLAIFLALLAAPAHAQAILVATPQAAYAKQADLSALQNQVASLPSQFDAAGAAASVAAAIPPTCPTTLSPDSLNGSIGTQGACSPRADASRPTVVQAVIVTTDATGAWAVSWAKPFNSVTPYINPQAINPAGTQPYICNVATSTTTSATGKCWQTVTTTLPSVALSLLGLIVNPTGTAAAIQVRVAARDTTQ